SLRQTRRPHRYYRSEKNMGAGWNARRVYELATGKYLAPTPQDQRLPIAPIFIAEKVSLAVSCEKDGKLRIVHAGWDDANVVQPDGYGQARGGGRRIYPLPWGSADPLRKTRTPLPTSLVFHQLGCRSRHRTVDFSPSFLTFRYA